MDSETRGQLLPTTVWSRGPRALFRVLVKAVGVWLLVHGSIDVVKIVSNGAVLHFQWGTGLDFFFDDPAVFANVFVLLLAGAWCLLMNRWIADFAYPRWHTYCPSCGWDRSPGPSPHCPGCGLQAE